MSNYLFVTGAGRSGTTLLDKLISMHPEALVFSQPLPLVYVSIKKEYMRTFHCPTTTPNYPLNDLFAENYCNPDAFMDYVWREQFPIRFYKDVLNSMIDYKGQYTKTACDYKLSGIQKMTMFQFVNHYTQLLLQESGRGGSITGSKETFSEEYIPYFIASGAKVIHIVRDPRDVLTSLSFGGGGNYSGNAKPHLFNIRQWRKSIAYALKMKGDSQYLHVRYEDLVMSPLLTMNNIARFLNIDAFASDAFSQGIYSQSGEVWASNSSYASSSYLSKSSMGNYRTHLSLEVRRFVEACCFYEMRHFDYMPEINESDIKSILSEHSEITSMGREDLKPYIWTDVRRSEELARIESLLNNRYQEQEFIFRNAFNLLRENIGV